MSIDFSQEESQTPLMTSALRPEDEGETSLRPKRLIEYIGQEKAKENLSVFIDAAKLRNEPLDHVLLHGPPGLGKTTLSGIIANEMGVNIRITSGPAIEKPGDLAALLTNLNENDILFVDEIHRLNRSVEEILYPAMEDFAIDIIIGKGPSANSIRLDLPRFTLIGATTRAGQLSAPLRDRFGVMLRLELYSPEELSQIVTRSARILGVPIEEAGAVEIARRARGTPRIANRLLRRVRDFAQVRAGGGHHPGGGRPGPHRPGGGPAGPGRGGPADAPQHHPALCRRPRRAGHLGRHRGGGGRDPGGRVRTLPHADWLPHPHPPGAVRHPPGLCAPGAALSGPGPGPAPPVTGDRVPAPGKCTKANGERQDFPRF